MAPGLGSIALAAVVGMVPATALWADAPTLTVPRVASTAAVESAYGKLPLSFEFNEGQTEARVQFLTRGRGHQLFLTPNEASLAVTIPNNNAEGQAGDAKPGSRISGASGVSRSVVRMKFEGADPHAKVVGLDKLPGIVNYFIGRDPSMWRTNIPTYQKVEYKQIYPGIDLVYYGNEGQLEYDLIVAPGADPAQIKLAFEGAAQIDVDGHGDLLLSVSRSSINSATGDTSVLRLHKPVVYQLGDQGERQLLAGSYVIATAETAPSGAASEVLHSSERTSSTPTPRVAFRIAGYDGNKPLIIDPVLSWSTYLGGSGGDFGNGIAVDEAGNTYVTGLTNTRRSGLPGAVGSRIQSRSGGGDDAFVTKLNAAGTAIVYSTYLGGVGNDEGNGIAVDLAGNAYVIGSTSTSGSGFPGVAGSSIQSTYGGERSDAFITKLNAAGTAIVYSTYLGGSGEDRGFGIAVDQAGHAFVTGYTQTPGSGFPGTRRNLIQNTYGGNVDAFVAKLNAAGTAIVFSTYLGGIGNDHGTAVAVDRAGNAYVTGSTETPGSGFPGTSGSPIQSTFSRFGNAFITKLNSIGTTIVYSTYLGGDGGAAGNGIAVDQAGNAYVTGMAGSGLPGAAESLIQSAFAGVGDSFVTKLNAAGTAIVYSTYLGGSGLDAGSGIAVDAAGQAYVTGITDAQGSSFPGTAGNSLQSTYGGGIYDAFIAKLNAPGTALLYSTYLGGMDWDVGIRIAIDKMGQAYVTGSTRTEGSGFPGTSGSLIQSTYGGGGVAYNGDAFVAKITSTVPFARFRPVSNIDLRPVQGKDWFDAFASFTLGIDSDGIAPLTEPVIIQIGTFFTTIPARAFKLKDGDFVFKGRIDGVKLYARFHHIKGRNYEFWTYANCATLTGTRNPVRVGLVIGDDSGSATITAKFGRRTD
jgi:hypothetical protein